MLNWAGHAGLIGKMRCIKKENLEREDHFKDLHLDGRMILKRISEKQVVSVWNGFIWLRIRTNDRFL
jgi:hypothetical protein